MVFKWRRDLRAVFLEDSAPAPPTSLLFIVAETPVGALRSARFKPIRSSGESESKKPVSC